MSLYIYSFISCLLTSLLLLIVFVYVRYKSLLHKNEELLEEKLEYIRKIEQLNACIEYKTQLISDIENNKQQSIQSTKAILYDLGNELSQKLLDIHKQETQSTRDLSAQNMEKTSAKFHAEFERLIGIITALNSEVTSSKDSVELLKQSLLSPIGSGQLAEITLENILKSSGLRLNLDFVIQYTISNDQNQALRPDALIFLPGDNLMVIDAKASRFLMDDSPEKLMKTMNNHLKSLNNKEYMQNAIENGSHKHRTFRKAVTLMFLPTEAAIEKIMQIDPNLITKAWNASIFLVGPTGLMNMLSFAKFQISEQMRFDNNVIILDEVKKLLLSVSVIAEHSKKLCSSIQNTALAYDKFAASFNKTFLYRASAIHKLGVDIGQKQLPIALERYKIISFKSNINDPELQDETSETKELIEAQ